MRSRCWSSAALAAAAVLAACGGNGVAAGYKWYPTTHTFEPVAFRDQVAWLRDTLPLGPESR